MGYTFVDPNGYADTIYHFDSDGRLVIERRQDVAPSLEFNEILRNETDGYTASRELKQAASIPPVIWEELLRSGIARDQKALRRWLNDPDNRKFRTSGGRL